MSDLPIMKPHKKPLEGARRYLVDYTEHLRTDGTNRMQESDKVVLDWRDFEILSLTCQDLIEKVQKLEKRIKKLEK